MSEEKTSTQVVVVGGGFGGLNAAKALARSGDVRVLLLDRRNHHLFQPLLYQVATAGLNPADIAVPIRAQFRRAPLVEVRMAEVTGVDLSRRVVKTAGAEVPYRFLVLACGASHSYFGHDEWEERAPGLKTLEQATEIRRRILTAFELAEAEEDAARRRALLTFVVVGAGPTGVELAGAIADIARTALRGDFRRIDPADARVVLLEAGPRPLASFAPTLSERARRDLEELGVEVRTGGRVEAIDAEGVLVAGERLASATVLWAAGVAAERLAIVPEVERDRAGRIMVGEDLALAGHPEVFVIGDLAACADGEGGLLPGLAPVAIQQGRHAAAMIRADLTGRPRWSFAYHDKGQMATIGKSRAIAEAGRLVLTGRLAWLAWLFVHVLYLIGFRNRVAVVAQWAWSYLFSKREARLITRRDWRLRPPTAG